MKTCSLCKEEKPQEAFSKDKSTPDGYRYRCRECRKQTKGSKPHNWTEAQCRKCAKTITQDDRYKGTGLLCKPCFKEEVVARIGVTCSRCDKPMQHHYATDASICWECRKARSHTEVNLYTKGCRCDDCRKQHAVRTKERAERFYELYGISGGSSWISPRERLKIYERDGYICQLCFEPVDMESRNNTKYGPSLDHILPRSMGGTHESDNLRLAHRSCNSVRGAARGEEEYTDL